MSEMKADWEKAWEESGLSAARGDGPQASFRAGYLAATEARAPREAWVVTSGWTPMFDTHGQLSVGEGQFCIFHAKPKDNDAEGYFCDSLTWDAETPPQWRDGEHGWDIDDVCEFHVMPARGASKAAPPADLTGEPVLIPAHVMAAHRHTYLKALEAVELVAGILAKDAGAEARNVHQFYAQAVAELRDGVTPESAAPPADEVAGLLEDITDMRRPYISEWREAALDRLEQHLKGKR